MKTVITNKQLNDGLLEIVNSTKFYRETAKAFFKDIYTTGCRPIELLRKDAWLLNETYWELKTAKTGEIRYFTKDALSEHFLHSWMNTGDLYFDITYDKVLHEFQRLSQLPRLFVNEKEVGLYLYRYNRARVMHDQSVPLPDIQNYFAWKNPANLIGYISTPLVFDG